MDKKDHRPFWTMRRKEEWIGWLFVLPEFLGIALVGVFPLLFTIYLSFNDWNLVGGFSSIKYVGFENYLRLFHDDKFIKAATNNLIFTAITVPVGMAIALVMSVAIHSYVRFQGYFKVAFFIPYICSTVAIAAVWGALFHPSMGPVNQFLMSTGISNPPKWLVDTTFAILAIAIISIWQLIGYKIIIYLAGLTNIPEELYESAQIDGATGIQQFFRITVPLLGPTNFFLLITLVIGSFKVFDIIKFLTEGGPNQASTVIVYRIYEEGFKNFRMGYASSMSIVLILIVIAVTSITWFSQKNKVHY
ncbi:MAG TPA: sugar ABC transporter permease [Bacilli bacterium]